MTTSVIPIMLLSMGVIAGSITGRVFQKQGVDGKMFSERILFNNNTHSLIDCALLCHDLNCCLTFTFSKVTHLCQGHFAVVTVNTPSSPADGAVTFSRENNESWLSRPCANSDGCPSASESGVECDSDRGQCSCSPYFYYSMSLNTCVPSCTDPHTTFVEYREHDLRGHDLYSFKAQTQECKDWCSADPDCRSIVIDADVGYGPLCFFKNQTAAERPSDWIQGRHTFVNWQKTCA